MFCHPLKSPYIFIETIGENEMKLKKIAMLFGVFILTTSMGCMPTSQPEGFYDGYYTGTITWEDGETGSTTISISNGQITVDGEKLYETGHIYRYVYDDGSQITKTITKTASTGGSITISFYVENVTASGVVLQSGICYLTITQIDLYTVYVERTGLGVDYSGYAYR
jgi:hypothetical protein